MKHNKRLFLSILIIALSTACNRQAPENNLAEVAITNLKCDYLINPLGIDKPNPRLSWKLESDQRGQKQSAYQVIVASSRDKLDKDVGDLWDSGSIESDQSLNVVYKY
jgi:alpha-L-rhamnosidase